MRDIMRSQRTKELQNGDKDMKNTKRLLAMILVACLCAGTVNMPVFAEEAIEEEQIEEIAEGYAGQPFGFYYVDAIAEAELYKEMRLQGTPTVQFYRNGELTNKFTGLREYEEIEFLIDRTMAGK